jgi:hypothetical protein
MAAEFSVSAPTCRPRRRNNARRCAAVVALCLGGKGGPYLSCGGRRPLPRPRAGGKMPSSEAIRVLCALFW